MEKVTKTGMICQKVDNIEFRLCKIEHTIYQNEEFQYVFTPNYAVIDLLTNKHFQGIPGLNLDLRKKEYVRKNKLPTFISERVPSKNREDLYDLLENVGLDYIDPLEYLFRTKLQYFGDTFYVIPFEENCIFDVSKQKNKCNIQGTIKTILDHLAAGDIVIVDGNQIDNTNRKQFFVTLLYLYQKSLSSNKEKQKEGIEQAKKEKKYRGRKPIVVDTLLFLEMLEKVEKKEIGVKEAAKKLGISVDKYYRFKKHLQK